MPRPVLILGAEPRIGATIARSLHRRDILVDVAALSPQEHRIWSRAVRRFVRLPDYRCAPDEFVETLTKIIRTEQFDMLIPTSDTALTVVAQYYQGLRTLIHVGCPPPHIVNRVLDKFATLEVARACGIGIPLSYLVSDVTELEGLDDSLRFPMIGKPRSKTDVTPFKTRYFRRFEELRDAFLTDTKFGRNLLLQQYCNGEGVGIAVLMQNGDPTAMFQHRRLKELPSTGGVSVMAVAEGLDQDLAEQAVTLLRALEWDGVAMVEFKQDHTTGQTALMEVNGRYWGTVSLAVQAGMDFPFYEWQQAHGKSPSVPASYSVGMRWRWATGDLVRLHNVIVDHHDGVAVPSRLKELARFFLDYRPSTSPALWSRRDPMPALSEFGRTAKDLLVTDAKKIIRKLIPASLLKHIRTARSLDPAAGSVYLRHQMLRVLGMGRDTLRRFPAGARSVLFVCHGNIIRSPMAAALLKQCLSDGDGYPISISSAGLHARPGDSADARALAIAREFGIPLDDHRAQPVDKEMIEKCDAIVVMDYLNRATLLARYPDAEKKVFLLGSITQVVSTHAAEIADPYHGNGDDIRGCYEILQTHIREMTRLLFPLDHHERQATHPRFYTTPGSLDPNRNGDES